MKKVQDKLSSIDLIALHFINELKSIIKDKGALLILIGAMLIYPVIYSFVYYYETLNDLPIAMVDLDRSAASRKYFNMIDATREIDIIEESMDLQEAKSLLLKNKIDGIVLIPKGFERDVYSGHKANVSVYADASYFLKYKNQFMATSYVNAYFSGGIAVKRYMAEGKSFEQAVVSNSPLSLQTHILYNPTSGYATFIMPGMILIIIQQTLLIGIGLMGGSFSESKSSPFLLDGKSRRKEVVPYLIGKSTAYLLISIINVVIAVIMIHSWFNYPDKSSIIEVMMLLFPYLLSTIFLGIGLSTLFIHRESAIVFMVFLSPIALFVSGISWPVSAIPDWLYSISKIMPSTTVVPAYLRLRTMGVGILKVKSELLFLYGQALVYFLMATIYFFKRIEVDERKTKALHV
jgi:ABC-2 type transport system permease protein